MSTMAFSQIIYEITIKNPQTGKPIISVEKAAQIMGVSESTIYDYRHDRTEPGYSKIKSLAHELNKRGYHKLSLQFWDNGSGKKNGCVQDETCRIISSLGKIQDNPNDSSVIMNEAGNIIKEGRNLRAEAE